MCECIQDAAKAAAAARGRQSYSGYSSEEEGEELSVEEQQAMEMENERLVEQLSSLTSQVLFFWWKTEAYIDFSGRWSRCRARWSRWLSCRLSSPRRSSTLTYSWQHFVATHLPIACWEMEHPF